LSLASRMCSSRIPTATRLKSGTSFRHHSIHPERVEAQRAPGSKRRPGKRRGPNPTRPGTRRTACQSTRLLTSESNGTRRTQRRARAARSRRASGPNWPGGVERDARVTDDRRHDEPVGYLSLSRRPPDRPQHFTDSSTTSAEPANLDGIRSVIWATGYRREYPWLHVPVLDATGEIRQYSGRTPAPGLYVIGMRWQTRRNSTFLDGVRHDAALVVDHLINGALATSRRAS